MNWTTLQFGKHKGHTLPYVILHDPDWFYWAMSQNVFPHRSLIAVEASTMLYKSTHITLPCDGSVRMQVEHYIDPTTLKYSHFNLVPEDKPLHQGASPTIRQPILDLSVPRNYGRYDKLGYRNLLSCFRQYFYGSKSARITDQRAQAFFDAEEHFIDLPWEQNE